jgi:hypothetical protein
MEDFWDLLFQLMKHGTNTLHVTLIFLFRVQQLADGLLPRKTVPGDSQIVRQNNKDKGTQKR